MVPLTVADLQDASLQFGTLEKRGSFYDMALHLVRAGFEIEGYVLFLATWNFASFRYAATNFDIEGLKQVLSDLAPQFSILAPFTIQTVDLDVHEARVAMIFDRLAAMKEVLFTGATKVMHLRLPDLFVIWDDYIRGGKPKKYYRVLPGVLSGKWAFVEYEKSGRGYVSFLRAIQSRVREITYPVGPVTLAKAIDEFNYVTVTLPIQEMEGARKEKKRIASAGA